MKKSVYVDDNSAAGPEQQLLRFEEVLRSRFTVGEVGMNERILGMNPRDVEIPNGRRLPIDRKPFMARIFYDTIDVTTPVCFLRGPPDELGFYQPAPKVTSRKPRACESMARKRLNCLHFLVALLVSASATSIASRSPSTAASMFAMCCS